MGLGELGKERVPCLGRTSLGTEPGVVEGCDEGGRVSVRCASGVLQARFSGAAPEAHAKVRVFVRAAPIRIVSPTSEHRTLAGRVVDAAFRGRGYEHVIELVDGHRLYGIFSEERSVRHENIGLHIPGDACVTFPRD